MLEVLLGIKPFIPPEHISSRIVLNFKQNINGKMVLLDDDETLSDIKRKKKPCKTYYESAKNKQFNERKATIMEKIEGEMNIFEIGAVTGYHPNGLPSTLRKLVADGMLKTKKHSSRNTVWWKA